MRFLLLFLLILFVENGPIIWRQLPQIRVGQLFPIRELITAGDDSRIKTDHNFTYLNPILVNNTNLTTDLQYGMSLISYQNWMTDVYSFNISMIRYDAFGGTLKFDVRDTTFFVRAKVHYIIIHRPQGSSPPNGNCAGPNCNLNIQSSYGCYLTSNLTNKNTSTVNRQQLVGGISTSQIAATHPDASKLLIFTMITGLKLSNNLGHNNYVKIDTYLNNSKLYHKVSVEYNNLLVFFCATNIIMDPQVHKKSYVSIIQTHTKDLTATNQGLRNVPFMDRYDSANRTFFGFSEFNHSMRQMRYIDVQTTNVSLIGQLWKTNSALNYLKYHMIFFAERACQNPTYTYYNPIGFDCVTTCATVSSTYTSSTTYFSNTSSLFCAPCHYSCQSCSNANTCTLCPVSTVSFRKTAPNGSKCDCLTGYVDDNVKICKLCNIYMSGCQDCSSKTFCNTCDASMNYVLKNIDTSNQMCTCRNGTYNATGYCLDYPGCNNVTVYNNIIACRGCDTNRFFFLNQTSQKCQCMYGYFPNSTLNNQTCNDICGDNIVAIGSSKCDDGNTQYGDGCDQFCVVQDGYDCSSRNTTTGGSICFLKQDIVITYLYSQKISNSNKYKMVFTFSPRQVNMSANDFYNKINTTLQTDNQKITFDPQRSFLIFQNDYNTDIQGTNQHMNVTFTNMSFFADPIQVYFTPTGINSRLVIDYYTNLKDILSMILTACMVLAVLVAIFASVVSLKLIGIQLIIPLQIIYFSLATVSTHRSATAALQSLKHASGYNTISPYSIDRTYPQMKNFIGMGLQTQFILASNIFFVLYILILLWLLFHHIKLRYKQKKLQQFLQQHGLAGPKTSQYQGQSQQSDQQQTDKQTVIQKQQNKDQNGDKEDKDSQQEQLLKQKKVIDQQIQQRQNQLREDNHRSFKFFGFYVDRLYFIFFSIIMNQVLFGFFIMSLGLPIVNYSYSPNFNSMTTNFAYFIVIANLVFIYTDQFTSKKIVFTCINDRYVFFYYILDFLIILILAFTFQYNFSIYVITSISLGYIVLIIIQKPYSSIFFSLQNLVALYLHIMLLACLVIICIINNNINMSQKQAIFYTIFIIGLIVLGQILTIIRLILKVNLTKAFQPLKNYNLLQNNKKQNRVIKKNLDLLQQQDKFLQVLPSDQIKNGLFTPKDRMIDWQSKNSSEYHSFRQQKQQHDTKQRSNQLQQQDQDQQDQRQSIDDRKVNQLDILKKKLRNNLKLKQESQEKSKIN